MGLILRGPYRMMDPEPSLRCGFTVEATCGTFYDRAYRVVGVYRWRFLATLVAWWWARRNPYGEAIVLRGIE